MSASSERSHGQLVSVDRTGDCKHQGPPQRRPLAQGQRGDRPRFDGSRLLARRDPRLCRARRGPPRRPPSPSSSPSCRCCSSRSLTVSSIARFPTAARPSRGRRKPSDRGWAGWPRWCVAVAGMIFLANAAEVAARYFLSSLSEMGLSAAERLGREHRHRHDDRGRVDRGRRLRSATAGSRSARASRTCSSTSSTGS